MKFASVEFELFVAEYYQGKVASAKANGHEWKLSLVSVRNLLRTEFCPYTGVAMTMPVVTKAKRPTDLTIDRIDNSKGYVPGNVMAVSRAANNFKSIFENPNFSMTMGQAEKALGKMQKRMAKAKSIGRTTIKKEEK